MGKLWKSHYLVGPFQGQHRPHQLLPNYKLDMPIQVEMKVAKGQL